MMIDGCIRFSCVTYINFYIPVYMYICVYMCVWKYIYIDTDLYIYLHTHTPLSCLACLLHAAFRCVNAVPVGPLKYHFNYRV